MKKFFLFTLLCVITITTQAQTNLSDYLTKRMPKRETRAVWLTTLASLDWPKNYARSEESIKLQKQELIDIPLQQSRVGRSHNLVPYPQRQ